MRNVNGGKPRLLCDTPSDCGANNCDVFPPVSWGNKWDCQKGLCVYGSNCI